jgi:hypothetical protein
MPRISSYPSGADTQNGRVLTPALKIIDWEHRTMNGSLNWLLEERS